MYPEYFDNGLEIRKNEGCNLTEESKVLFKPNTVGYEGQDQARDDLRETYQAKKVRIIGLIS